MEWIELKEGFFIRLDRGEEVIGTLTEFAKKRGLLAGFIQGIGGIGNVTLGYFDREEKKYTKKTLAGNFELVSLLGNISLLRDEPFIHAHAVVSGPDFGALSGHLFSAEITLTGEFLLRPISRGIQRHPDPETGLNLLCLK